MADIGSLTKALGKILAKPDPPEISLPIEMATQVRKVAVSLPPSTSRGLVRDGASTDNASHKPLPDDVESHVVGMYKDFIQKSDSIIFSIINSENLNYKTSVEFANYSWEIVGSLLQEFASYSYQYSRDKKFDIRKENIVYYVGKISKIRSIAICLIENYIGSKKQSSIESLSKFDRLEILNDFASRHVGRGLIECMARLFPEWISPEERETFVQQLGQSAQASWAGKVVSERESASAGKISAVPESAPAFWKDDKLSGDTPPDFIKRHYGPWLKSDATGLTRPDIKRLDRSLYMALANWLRKNELPDDCPVPIKSQRLDSELARVAEGGLASVVSGDDPAAILKNAQRLLSAKRRRER